MKKNISPSLIGICGGSCSGKTTVLKLLKEQLGEEMSELSFDDYFTKPQDQTITDWESPSLYRYNDFERDLAALKGGQAVQISSNSRESDALGLSTKLIEPKKYIFVEGFLIFYSKSARASFDVKYFIDTPMREIIRRRLARRLGSDRWDSENYIKGPLVEAYATHVLPQRAFAHDILDGFLEIKAISERILSHVQKYFHETANA